MIMTNLKSLPFARLSLFGGYSQGQTKQSHSYKRMTQGIVTAIASRAIAVIVSLISVPLTIHYLGPERYGAWITLTSILTYLTIFDLGIGNTVANGVSEALAKGSTRLARRRVNTAYLSLTVISIGITALIALAWPLISWPAVLGIRTDTNRDEISMAAATAIMIVLASFPLSVTPRVMGACHKVTISNFWNSVGSVASLLLLFFATRIKSGLPGLVWAVSGSTLIVGICSTVWLYKHFSWLRATIYDVKWSGVRELFGTAMPFFAVQISGIILFQTDNLVIAQVLGASAVTPYNVTWKLFSYASILQVIALPTLWPAYSDAFARRDFKWVRKTYRYNLLIAVGTTAVFVLVLFLVSRKFILIWAGPSAVPSMGLVLGMGIWTIVSSVSWCESCLLGAAGQVKGQALYSGIGSIVNLISSILLARIFGLLGIILGTLVAYALCILIPQTADVMKLLKGVPTSK